MAESSLKFRDNHFSDEGTEAVVPHHHPASSDVPRPIIYDELSETDRNCLLRRERESLVQKLATSVIEVSRTPDGGLLILRGSTVPGPCRTYRL